MQGKASGISDRAAGQKGSRKGGRSYAGSHFSGGNGEEIKGIDAE